MNFGLQIRRIQENLRSFSTNEALISKDILLPLQNSVYKHLNDNIYPRFLSSTKGRECFTSLLLESELQISLVRSEMVHPKTK